MDETQLLKKKQRAKPENKGRACEKLGEYYLNHGQYEKAFKQFNEKSNYLNTPISKAMNNRKLGETLMFLKKFSSALRYISAYLKWAKDNNDKVEIQRAYATLGRLHVLHAEACEDAEKKSKLLNEGEKASQKSLSICKSLTNLPKTDVAEMEGRLFLNLSLIKEFQMQNDAVIDYLKKAIELCRKNHLLELGHQCYMNIAHFYFTTLSNNSQAFHYIDLAVEIGEKIAPNEEKLCDAFILKAKIFIKLGDFRSAKQIFHKAYKLKTSDPSQATQIESKLKTVAAMCYAEDKLLTANEFAFDTKRQLYEKLGDGACKLKNFNKAIHYYLLALKNAELSDHPELASLFVSLYETYKDNKQFDLSLEYMEKELELNKSDSSEACLTLKNIANIYEELNKSFWDIDNIYQQAREEAMKAHNKKLEQSVILKQLQLRQKHGMETLVEILKDEARMADIDINEPDSQAESEDFESEPKNVTDIGDDICLDDLTDDDNEVASTSTDTRQLRRRGTTFKVKRNEKGETQLHQACISGNYAKAKQLIDVGHPVNVSDNAGWTPLHEACNHEHVDIVELLLEQGASVDDHGGNHCDGLTPLHSACMAGSLKVIDSMLDAGAKVTVLDNNGDTPLKTLEKWKMREQLDMETDLFYQTIRKRMIDILNKTGVTAEATTSSDNTDYYTPDATMTTQTTTSTSPLCSDSDEDSEKTFHKKTKRSFSDLIDSTDTSSDSQQGASDYKCIMESLRGRNKHIAVISPKKTPTKYPAALNPGEIGDDWLENDMQPSKKRKLPNTPMKDLNCRSTAISDQEYIPETESCEQMDSFQIESDTDSNDAYAILMNAAPSTSSHRIKRTKSLSKTSRLIAKKPSKTLLHSGFYKSIQSSSSSIDSIGNAVVSSSQDPEPIMQETKASNLSFVKVEIEDQKLIVPIKTNVVDDLTIKWLAEEAARRYYNLKGLEPLLRLTTEDGAVYEDSDPLSVVLTGAVVCSTVLDWSLPSITQRYMEACTSMKIGANEFIQESLDLIQATQSLQITDNVLDVTMCKPLFKSLHHQSNLTMLILSNNYLTNDGVKCLAQSLPTLKQLKSLSLSGNLISADGIQYLADIFINNPTCLSELQSLDISFNPLQNRCIPYLSKLCRSLHRLMQLNVSSTDLSEYLPCDINFNQLTELDLSFNQFKLKHLSKWIKELNPCKLVRLNIAFATDCSGISECLSSLLHSGTCENLTELNVSGLHLTDGDVWQLLQSISRSKHLSNFYLEENPELSSITLKLLLERLPIDHLHLIGCPKIVANFKVDNTSPINLINGFCKKISLTVDSLHRYQMQQTFKQIFGADRCHFDIKDSIASIHISEP